MKIDININIYIYYHFIIYIMMPLFSVASVDDLGVRLIGPNKKVLSPWPFESQCTYFYNMRQVYRIVKNSFQSKNYLLLRYSNCPEGLYNTPQCHVLKRQLSMNKPGIHPAVSIDSNICMSNNWIVPRSTHVSPYLIYRL